MSLRTAVASASRPALSRSCGRSVRAASSAASTSTATEDWTPPEIHLGATHASRYGQHYSNTLSSDLLYMTYNHRADKIGAEEAAEAAANPPALLQKTGYEANRPQAVPRGNRPVKPVSRSVSPTNIPQLESITLHTFVKDAIGHKHQLLTAIMALRAISGETQHGAGRAGSSGVQVVASRNGAAAWKLRAGMPVAAKVELRGEPMYDFLQSLVDFVLPRIREFPGFQLPPVSASKSSPSAMAGVVSVGLSPRAMGLFPQVEANIDAYPKMYGMHIHFKTNMRGRDAQEHARALLSGFRIPFYKK